MLSAHGSGSYDSSLAQCQSRDVVVLGSKTACTRDAVAALLAEAKLSQSPSDLSFHSSESAHAARPFELYETDHVMGAFNECVLCPSLPSVADGHRSRATLIHYANIASSSFKVRFEALSLFCFPVILFETRCSSPCIASIRSMRLVTQHIGSAPVAGCRGSVAEHQLRPAPLSQPNWCGLCPAPSPPDLWQPVRHTCRSAAMESSLLSSKANTRPSMMLAFKVAVCCSLCSWR